MTTHSPGDSSNKDDAMAERVMQHIRSTFGKAPAITSDTPQRELGKKDEVVHNIKDSHKKNFDEKIYWFPESYNQLRKEIFENWPNLWAVVGYRMAFIAEEFVENMNAALDMNLVLDSEKVDAICTAYLEALWKLRGHRQ